MSTPSAQLDRVGVAQQVQETVQQLLVEMGSPAASRALAGAHLERDLSLGSLERVELMLRLGQNFGVHLPDQVVAEANTVDDLVAAVLTHSGNAATLELLSPELAPVRRHALPAARHGGHIAESADSLTEVLQRHAHAGPTRPHIYLRDEDGSTRAITYGELLERAAAVAGALQSRGLQPGQAVAIMLPTCREFFYTFFGVQLAGGIPVPIYPPFRADRIEEYAARQAAILRNAEVRILVTFRQAERVAKLLKPRVSSLSTVVDVAKLVEGAPSQNLYKAKPDDIAFLQYTSGSTGEPKGVTLTHANLLANIRDVIIAVGITPEDVAVTWLPLYHDMGLIGTWLTPLYFGIPTAVLSPLAFLSRPERWLWAIHHHRGSITAAPNFAYELCVRKVADSDIEGLDLSSWRAALNGAEPVNPETLDRFTGRFAKYGFRREAMLPVYGLAEASLGVAIPPLERGPVVDCIERDTFEREGRAVLTTEEGNALKFVSAGLPVRTCEVRIVDDGGNDLPERREGRLWIRGPSVTRGYYRNAEATRDILREGGWLDTGDRAYLAGGEIYITGRVKDIIIKAGRNLYPHEVEEVAGRVEGVRTGCVVAFGLRDEKLGTERLVVVAETREQDAKALTRIAAAITEGVAATLSLPPDLVELVPPQSIPKTSSGKLRRDETKKLYLAGKLGRRKPPAWVQVARLAASGGAHAARSGLRRTLELGYGLWCAVAFAAFLLPTWTLVYFIRDERRAARITRIGTRIFFRLIGCPIRIEGTEHRTAKEAHVFVANHTSFLDVLVVLATFAVPYRFVSKREVLSWPFIGTFLKRRQDFAFTREDPQARLQQADQIEEALRQGISVLIFPEGTFTPAEGVRAFQLGAFKAAVSTGRAICPVGLRGVRNILRDGTTFPRPGSITMTICPPIAPQGDTWQEIVRLRDAARAVISEHCGEHLL